MPRHGCGGPCCNPNQMYFDERNMRMGHSSRGPMADEMVYRTYKMVQEMEYKISSIKQIKQEKTMSTVGNMMKRLLDKDTQTLVKAGYINGDLELTEAGKKALWAIIFEANKPALVIEAQEALDAEKK